MNRSRLRRIPIVGYLLSLVYALINLPKVFSDLHGELVGIRRSLSELQEPFPGSGPTALADLLRSHVRAQLVDHAALLKEHSEELMRIEQLLNGQCNSLRQEIAETRDAGASVAAVEAVRGEVDVVLLALRESVADWKAGIEALPNLQAAFLELTAKVEELRVWRADQRQLIEILTENSARLRQMEANQHRSLEPAEQSPASR